MRIIAGQYKGREVVSTKGHTTRPTTSYNRELIFSTLFDVTGLSVLDLFSGSGALAFEALSRGANDACLVDMSDKALSSILLNAERFGCKEQIIVQKMKVEHFLRKTERRFDLILADPPYMKNCVNTIIRSIIERNILTEDGTLVIEHSSLEPISEEFIPYMVKQKKNKKNCISFFENISNN